VIGLQDYWRQLSANCSIVTCGTANPTSFLSPVVGSASLLSATAISWRLAINGVTGQRSYIPPPFEVGRRLPSALTQIVNAPFDRTLESTATLARPQDALDFLLNGAVREVDRGRRGGKSVIRIGAVRLEETRVEDVVDLAIQNVSGKI